MAYYAGVDLGATKIKAAVADGPGSILAQDRRLTPQGPRGIDVTEAVLRSLRTTCSEVGITPDRLRAVGVGSFGPFDMAEGMVVNPTNLPESVDRIPLVGPIRQLVGSQAVYLHNDTTAGVIGERFTARRNPDDMVYVTFSTGIGAGITVDGEVLDGWDGNAGEVGHFLVDPDRELMCGCGIPGHWEAYASGSGIPRYARHLATQDDAWMDTELPVDEEGFDASTVFEYLGEDPLADHVVAKVGEWNCIGIANIVHAYAPLVVSVGGAVALHNEEAILGPLRSELDDIIMSNVPEIRLTALGDDVVVRGALASAMTGGTGDRTVMT